MSTLIINSMVFKVGLVCLVVVLGSAAAWGVVPDNPYTSNPFSGTLGNFPLVATVTYDSATQIYTYNYALTYTGATRPLSTFSVGNIPHYEWSLAGCDVTTYFPNPPVYTTTYQNSIRWDATTAMPSRAASDPAINFWYTSYFPYTVVNVSASGGGKTASGQTLGLVPEPASLGAIGLGIAGVGSMFLRKLRRRAR